MVAFQQNSDPNSFMVTEFSQSLLVTDQTEGCMQTTQKYSRLTTPHSVTQIDFDGDCISDLFLTIEDKTTG